jgi:hypothetical protein
MSRLRFVLFALALCAPGCVNSTETCLSVGVNYAGTLQGVVILTAASTIDSGLQFVTSLPAVPPADGEVGASVCHGAATGDTVLVVAWLDDGGTGAFCTLPLQPECSPPAGVPQTSQLVSQIGGQTTMVHLVITDPDAGM